MKIQVSEATPVQLNYLVGVAEGFLWQTDDPDVGMYCLREGKYRSDRLVLVALDYARMDDWSLTLYAPAESWSVVGPIIEREGISIEYTVDPDRWCANIMADQEVYGPTALIAAMRCYVASRLGDEVEIPDELV